MPGGTRIGSNISMHTDNGAAAQQWAIIPEGVDGGYTIRVRCSGYAMNVADGGTANGTNVNQYPYKGGPNQVWRFVKAEHTISYDANGGNGAPSSQTKYYKGKLLLSETVPAREGYLFAGWAGSPEAGTAEYRPGDVYSADEDVTLYARWISNDDVQEFPSHLETVGNGAFSNTDMKAIRLHAEVISIGENAFDEDTIIVAPEGSYAAQWAEAHGMQVIFEN